MRTRLTVNKDNRPWLQIKMLTGGCEDWCKILFSEHKMRGAAWSGWDCCQETLLPKIEGCLGLVVTEWSSSFLLSQKTGWS